MRASKTSVAYAKRLSQTNGTFRGETRHIDMRVGLRVAIGLVAVITVVAASVITRDTLIGVPLPGSKIS